MNQSRHEPLTPEERALVERLARIGPNDGPSPALDAKILAAAHAAVAAPPRRRRWLALSTVPGGLITGVGMAAALALVVGVVWQLRPGPTAVYAPRDDAGDAGTVSAEMIRRPRPQPPAPPPPAAHADAAAARTPTPTPAKQLQPPPARRQVAKAAPAPAAPPAPPPPAAEAPAAWALDENVVDAPAPAAPATYMKRRAPAVAEPARESAAVAPPAAPAPAYAPAPPAAVVQSQVVATDSAAAAAPAAAERAANGQAATLDRIEITGSAIAFRDLPVQADAELAVDAWIERIRARRDADDLDGARASLALFRQQHPRHRLPDDLRTLASSTPTR